MLVFKNLNFYAKRLNFRHIISFEKRKMYFEKEIFLNKKHFLLPDPPLLASYEEPVNENLLLGPGKIFTE